MEINANTLHWDNTKKLAMADMSDIGIRVIDRIPKEIAIVNSDRRTYWSIKKELYSEGSEEPPELLACVYAPKSNTLKKFPQLKGYKLQLAND